MMLSMNDAFNLVDKTVIAIIHGWGLSTGIVQQVRMLYLPLISLNESS